MASLGEDTYRHGIRIGKAEGLAEGRAEAKASIIIRLVSEEGWSVDRAMEFAEITDDIRDVVEKKVKAALG